MLPAEVLAGFTDQSLGQSATVAKYNSVEDLVRGHEHASTFLGKSIQLPEANGDYDKWAGEQSPKLKDHGWTLSKLSEQAPPTPDAYDFKVEGVDPEAVKTDKAVQAFRGVAHKMGLSNAKANELISWYNNDVVKMLHAQMQEAQGEAIPVIEDDAQIEAIHQEHFKGETQQRQEAFKQGVSILGKNVAGLDDFLQGMAMHGGNQWLPNGKHPVMVHLISEIGRMTAQDFGGHAQGAPVVDGNAQQEIEKIMHDTNHPKNALWKKGDKATREYVDELWKRTTGGK